MKKEPIILFLILGLLLPDLSLGFVQKRHEWWKIRFRELKKEQRAIAQNPAMEKYLGTLIKTELAGTREALTIFNKHLENKSSLHEMARNFDNNDIAAATKRMARPIYDLMILTHLLSKVNSKEHLVATRNYIKNSIHNLMRRDSGTYQRALLEDAVNGEIDLNSWKLLSFELFVGSIMKNRDKRFDDFQKKIAARIRKNIKTRPGLITESEFEQTIKSHVLEEIIDFNFVRGFGKSSRDDSWSWRLVLESVRERFRHYEKIVRLMKECDLGVESRRVRYYYYNPERLDTVLFSYLKKEIEAEVRKHQGRPSTKKVESGKKIDGTAISILLRQVDRVRRQALARIKGNEKGSFYRDLDKTISEKIKALLGNNYSGPRKSGVAGTTYNTNRISGESTTGVPKNQSIMIALQAYHGKSINFVQWFSGFQKVPKKKIVLQYQYRTKRNREYVQFIQSLVESSVGVSAYKAHEFQVKLAVSVRKIQSVFKLLGLSMSAIKFEISRVDKVSRNRILKMRNTLREDMENVYHAIRLAYKETVQRKQAIRVDSQADQDLVRERVAEFEIEHLFLILNEQYRYYKKLDYAPEAFARYHIKYNELTQGLKKGIISPDLERAIRKRTVIPVVNGFEITRVRNEYRIKRYLRKRIEIGLSKLMGLVSFYSRGRIKIKNRPDADEIKKIRIALRVSPSVRIVRWYMKESNFQKIDANAVKSLIRIRNMQIWQKKTKTVKDKSRKININELGVSVHIPRGWTERKLSHDELARGIVRSYESYDKKALIYIAQNSIKSLNLKDVNEYWIAGMGNKKVQMKWGSKDSKKYYWSVSKNKSRDIMESFAVKIGDISLIVSGVTSRERYRFFHQRIQNVFDSIKF